MNRATTTATAGSPETGNAAGPDISVIVLGWNGRDYVDDCLSSLTDQDIRRPYEVIFVDNGSTDGTPDVVASRYPAVRLERLAGNHGYCIGNNIGFGLARGKYVLFLNQDTVLHKSCLSAFVHVLESGEGIEAAHANVIQPWYPEFKAMERTASVGAAYTADLSPLGFIHYRKVPHEPEAVDTLFLHGVAIAVRRELMDRLEYPFDPGMWAYAEDLDLALRTRAAGFRTVVATHAVVYHKHTLDTGVSWRTFTKTTRIIRNRLLAFWKCCTWPEFLPLAAITVLGAPANAGEFGLPVYKRIAYYFLLIPPALAAVPAAITAMPGFAKRRRAVLEGRQQPPFWFLRTVLGDRSNLGARASSQAIARR